MEVRLVDCTVVIVLSRDSSLIHCNKIEATIVHKQNSPHQFLQERNQYALGGTDGPIFRSDLARGEAAAKNVHLASKLHEHMLMGFNFRFCCSRQLQFKCVIG